MSILFTVLTKLTIFLILVIFFNNPKKFVGLSMDQVLNPATLCSFSIGLFCSSKKKTVLPASLKAFALFITLLAAASLSGKAKKPAYNMLAILFTPNILLISSP